MINVDDILFEFIKAKLSEFKSDPSLANEIFKGKTTEQIESIKRFLLENEVKVVMHHPRDSAEWPCFAIVLEGTTESTQVIGQSGDDYSELDFVGMDDGWIGSDSLLLQPEDRPYPIPPEGVTQMYSAATTKDNRRSCHLIANKGASAGKGIFIDLQNSQIEGGYVSLVGMEIIRFWVKSPRVGTFLEFGFGESSANNDVTPVTVTARNVWERITLDITGNEDSQKDKIRYLKFEVTNDSDDTDIYISNLRTGLSLGALYDELFLDHRYRIESWSNNAILTLHMHNFILWNLLKYRTYLQNSWGIFNQRVDGADIMYQPDFMPEFAYIRGLVFSGTVIEPIPRETDLTALDIKLGRIDHY